ncbi:MAG: hypothetical protein KatS3mg053_2886 [Candidatus Roseilinea sp.]|nr:MAG: hypothetical protein KatS3mg053_2886 [Candidatus Roseilinea sp.]
MRVCLGAMMLCTAQATQARTSERVSIEANFSTRHASFNASSSALTLPAEEEFVGPFASWANVKTDYGAKGDGLSDDTAALQQALDRVGQAGAPGTLFIPAGVYRVTNTLRLQGRQGVNVIGADPEQVVLKWDGATGGDLFEVQGVSYSKLARFTLDGAGKARVLLNNNWPGNANYFPTGNEHSEIIFKDAQVGILAGQGDGGTAETVVARCRFLRLSDAGVKTTNYNALDWFIWDSLFEDNAVGVHNVQGGFHVYRSVFRRSAQADIKVSNKMFFALRGNYSIDSRRFLLSEGASGNPSGFNVQGNVILDTIEPAAIFVNDAGPLMLLDNLIRSRANNTGPAVFQSDFGPGVVTGIGNTFTVSNPWNVDSRSGFTQLDNNIISRAGVNPSEPVLPGFWVKQNRPVIEVPPNADSASIQAALDQAFALRGQRPIVHLPEGSYSVRNTLIITAESDVQLVGDGLFRTQLNWIGDAPGPVLRIVGPSRATLRDLMIGGANATDAVVMERIDQTGARIVADQIFLSGRTGLLANGLDDAVVNVRTYYAASIRSGQATLRVVGGPRLTSGDEAPGAVHIFSGATSNNDLNLQVVNGGRLTYTDVWFEGASEAMVNVGGKSTVTINGGNYAAGGGGSMRYVTYDADFAGRLSLINTRSEVTLTAPATLTAAARVLAMNDLTVQSCAVSACGLGKYRNDAPGRAFFMHNLAAGGDIQGYVSRVPDLGTADAAALREFYAQLRARQLPSLDAPAAMPGQTDVRLYRISLSAAVTGLHLVGGGSASPPIEVVPRVRLPMVVR